MWLVALPVGLIRLMKLRLTYLSTTACRCEGNTTPNRVGSWFIYPVVDLFLCRISHFRCTHKSWNWSSSCGRQPVDQFVLVSGSPLGPMTRFYPCPFVSDNCLFSLPVVRPLWREDGSVTYSAIADWSGHWGPITTHYRLIWHCVPSSSPLTTRRDYSRVFELCTSDKATLTSLDLSSRMSVYIPLKARS
jgi:hypothetical protein